MFCVTIGDFVLSRSDILSLYIYVVHVSRMFVLSILSVTGSNTMYV